MVASRGGSRCAKERDGKQELLAKDAARWGWPDGPDPSCLLHPSAKRLSNPSHCNREFSLHQLRIEPEHAIAQATEHLIAPSIRTLWWRKTRPRRSQAALRTYR
jgi:hypothetical protein